MVFIQLRLFQDLKRYKYLRTVLSVSVIILNISELKIELDLPREKG